jgi:single-strand DNA-binding protein
MIEMNLIGHIGKDCVVKELNGKNVINFSVAHTEKYTDHQGVKKESTTWVECAYWTEKTAVAPYLTKGKLVYVKGQPSSDSYTKDGKTFSTLRLRVAQIQLLGGAESNSGSGRPASTSQSSYSAPVASQNNNDSFGAEDPTSDLPF